MFLIFNLFKYGILSSIIEICNRLNRLFFLLEKGEKEHREGASQLCNYLKILFDYMD